MEYGPSDSEPGHDGTEELPTAIKILIAGGFGVGKTTMVSSVSEIEPLRTEEVITDQSLGVDDMVGVEAKTTTTVAMDFGRITVDSGLLVYLFGTPGQDRFWFMWDELVYGALGAIVLADTAGWPTASPPSTSSNAGTRPSSSRSTASTALGATRRRTSGSPSTSIPTCRSCSATPATGNPAKRS